ncbi:MAG: hypothetical protein H6744_02130 [Deltaproteobacteria bacterium]|nr:hypothetical protein [Deltaproteobacteria bacterium]MCB9785468.1 hypothetical protein [Deltaproteobacteria bacterium]
MSMDVDTIVEMAMVGLPEDSIPDEGDLDDLVARLIAAFGLSEVQRVDALERVLARCRPWMRAASTGARSA